MGTGGIFSFFFFFLSLFKRKKLRFTIVELTQVLKGMDTAKIWTKFCFAPKPYYFFINFLETALLSGDCIIVCLFLQSVLFLKCHSDLLSDGPLCLPVPNLPFAPSPLQPSGLLQLQWSGLKWYILWASSTSDVQVLFLVEARSSPNSEPSLSYTWCSFSLPYPWEEEKKGLTSLTLHIEKFLPSGLSHLRS